MEVSRRQFLGSVAPAALTAGGYATPATADPDESIRQPPAGDKLADGEPPYGPSHISLDGIHELANLQYQQKKKGNALSFDKKVNAVKDLGLDPNGNEPIEPVLNSKIESGMLVVMPYGDYKATGEIRPGIDGKFGIVGKGYQKSKKPPKPGKNSVVIKVKTSEPINLFNIGPLDAGLFGNFVIDQRNPRPHGAVQVRSAGNVRVRDIRTVGAQTQVTGADDNPGFFVPMAKGNDSLVVMARCIARGGGIPGTKNIGGSYGVGVFGRGGNRGTVILKNCVIENMPDNGIYGSRTDANVRVLGGLYRNNDVSQVRVNSGKARVDGVDVVIDEKHYTGLKSKSYGRERGAGWPGTNGIKIETKASIAAGAGTAIVNSRVAGVSVVDTSSIGALIHLWDSSGAVTIDNTKVINHVAGTTSIFAENPGSGLYPAPGKRKITVKNSLVEGKAAGESGPAVNINGRPRSRVKATCFRYAGANKDDIAGAWIDNCGFGKQCTGGAGLRAPKKVGSGSPIPTVPISVGEGSPNEGNWIAKIAGGVMRMIGLAFLFFVGLVGLVVLAISSLFGD